MVRTHHPPHITCHTLLRAPAARPVSGVERAGTAGAAMAGLPEETIGQIGGLLMVPACRRGYRHPPDDDAGQVHACVATGIVAM
jgi:hypothetical protein